MNGDGLDSSDLAKKLDLILNFLKGSNNKQGFTNADLLYSEEKKEKEKTQRLRQKQRLYQAMPIAIDGFTIEGKKDLQKLLKNAFSFNIDVKKPEDKFPWLKIILGLLAFAAGLIIGFISGAIGRLKIWGSLITKSLTLFKKGFLNVLENLRKSKLGQLLEEVFSKIRSKFLSLLEKIRKTKVGQYVEEVFTTVRGKFTDIIKRIRNSNTARMVEEAVADIKAFFNNVTKAVREFNPLQSIRNKLTQITQAIEDIFKGITVAVRENKAVKSIISVFESIGEFFKPLTALVPRGGGGAIVKALTPIFEVFQDIAKFAGKWFAFGFKYGKILGDALGPIMAIIEVLVGLYQAFTDPKLKDKSFLQKALTGVVTGILEFLTGIFQIIGLDLFDYTEVRDRIDKIFESFNDGFINGILQLVNQLLSLVNSIPIKIVGWIVGWFNKDAGDAIKEYGKNFDWWVYTKNLFNAIFNIVGKMVNFVIGLFKEIPKKLNNVKNLLTKKMFNLVDMAKETVFKIIDWIKSIFSWETLKKLLLKATPLDFSDNQEPEKAPKPAGDLKSESDRYLYARGQSYKFDPQDQIIALKQGGPLENAIKSIDAKTNKSVADLKKVVEELSNRFDSYFEKTTNLYNAELKLMDNNNKLLQDLKNKEVQGSNVVVNNNSSNMVFSQKSASNLEYRSDLFGRKLAY